MQRKLGLTTLACFIFFVSWSQASLRKIDNQRNLDLKGKKYQEPQDASIYYLEYESLTSSLSGIKRGGVTIQLPVGHNDLKTFEVSETFMMEEGLARKYPSIKTYRGISTDGSYMANFDIGPFGLHASIVGQDGDVYMEPVTNGDVHYYYFYKGKDQTGDLDHLYSCGTKHEGSEVETISREQIATMRSANFELLEYRVAIACTGEWGGVRGTKEKALADMVTSVNRLNQIFEIDLGIKIKLIDRNDELIFLDGTMDPFFVANVGGALLPENTGIINSIVGVANYDFGHVYTNSCTDVGGVAYLRSACAGNKGGGVSCFGGNLLGSTNRVVAHEMGHQFGANHTFHNCGENVSLGNDFEPGSGTTIMSYAGACGSNNVASSNDNYYHNASLVEIYRYMRTPSANGRSCANIVETQNVSPVITSVTASGYTLPKSTPFILEGTAVDGNENDLLTYCWEQKDSGLVVTPLGSPSGNAPLFRSFIPTDRRDYRVFPNQNDLLLGVANITEVLPSYTRKMAFTFTVRDNNPEAGAVAWEYVKLNVTDQAGPFLITGPNNNAAIKGGDKIEVTWDVANTNQEPVNCKSVNIYLSIAGDLNPKNLIPVSIGTPNIGNATVTIPDTVANSARFVVKASDNIFFDVSNVYFPINKATEPGFTFISTAAERSFCLPATSGIHVKTSPIAGFDGSIRIEYENVPQGIIINSSKDSILAGEEVDLDVVLTNQTLSGTYQITLLAIADALADTTRTVVDFEVVSTNFVGLSPLSPINGTQNLEGLPQFTWSPALNASSYELEVSKSPTFDEFEVNVQVTDTARASTKLLDKADLFFWRVRAINECGVGSYTPVQVFGTETLACKDYDAKDLPINITQSGKPMIESKILIADNFNIVDLNVKSIAIDHDNFKDLKGTLVSPTGKTAVMFNSQCPRRMTLNIGFDNDAPSFFTCATGSDVKYKPTETLDIFNGENSAGNWTFMVEDVNSGNGGQFKAFTLQLCGNIEVTRPVVAINEVPVSYKKTAVINQAFLAATSTGTTPENLKFTILRSTYNGTVSKSGVALKVGDTFTQADVNSGLIIYENIGPELAEGESALDLMELIVENNASGWEGSFALNFDIQNMSTPVGEVFIQDLKIFPNPANASLNIVLPEAVSGEKLIYRIFSYDGKMVQQGKFTQDNNTIEVEGHKSGYYLIQVMSEKKKFVGRFVKI